MHRRLRWHEPYERAERYTRRKARLQRIKDNRQFRRRQHEARQLAKQYLREVDPFPLVPIYNRDGKRIPMRCFGVLFESFDTYRCVKRTDFAGSRYRVHTSWLGLTASGEPFETAAFPRDSWAPIFEHRSWTVAEALEAHACAVNHVAALNPSPPRYTFKLAGSPLRLFTA